MPPVAATTRGVQAPVPSPTQRATNLRRRGEPSSPQPSAVTVSPPSPFESNESPEVAMDRFLHAQEATLGHLLEVYAASTNTTEKTPVQSKGPHSAATSPHRGLSSSSTTTTTAATAAARSQRAATAPQSSINAKGVASDAVGVDVPTLQGDGAHRAQLITELLRRDKASQWAVTVGRTAAREREELKRAVALESSRLALAQKKNAALRDRLETLTCERRDAAVRRLQPHSSSTALVATNTDANSQLALSSSAHATGTAGDYTNEIIEARRQLDQRTRELQESQDRLHQLQQYHLDQLSGQFRPMLFAEDALRTTENFLDTETNMAVRATVVDALLEVNAALKPLSANDTARPNSAAVLPCLETINSLWDRLAVQNFVVGRINRLFTCMCPTAPPLTLLKDTNMM